MSRNQPRSGRGRPPTFGSTPKLTKPKDNPTPTHRNKGKPNSKLAAPKITPNKRKRAPSTSSSDDLTSLESSDSADDASDEEEDDESADDLDDEDELPAVIAPSRSKTKTQTETGRKSNRLTHDNLSVADSADSMFGDFNNYFDEDDDPRLSPEENRKRFEQQVFADSDDGEIYQAVDDISDSEDDYSDEHVQEQELLALLSEEEYSEADDLLNHIDGLSAYGFGDDSDASIHGPPSSQNSDTEIGPERRVHFAIDADRIAPFIMRMSSSPTITRALLPSALPDQGNYPHANKKYMADELDDSDLTDDCLPEQAHTTPIGEARQTRDASPSASPPNKKSSKKSPRRRGPPRGIFIDDGEKPSGILDPSGKIILMTNPHLLGEEFARRYGASQTSSPDMGFAELMDDSDAGDNQTGLFNTPTADIMLASLNSARNNHSNQGQAIGPLEAFYPSNILQFGDYAIDPDDLEGDYQPDEDLGEDVINLEDVIQFDEDTDDSDVPTSPILNSTGRQFNGMGSHGLSHLNNSNVTAFRRNADPAFAAFSNTPSYQDLELFTSPYATPAPRRKRKPMSSPYTSSHYKGVTPVQRMRDPGKRPSTPDTSTPAKRRKLMT
ncbi:hypothetical protein B0A52_08675 [Exophiala mesophila]|uniref:Uncharacterized protein n=1 Tax=Exophiala mesophila TaxID=212818 RepID=A0A438MWN4_EXOME|nr:hypothetical protein B0A52_08675 [Exophiala mesophila]